MSADTKVAVRVLGVGGVGCRVVGLLRARPTPGVETLLLDTDTMSLRAAGADPALWLAMEQLRGLGAGGRGEVAIDALAGEVPRLEQAVADARVIVVVGALGGGTASVVMPALAGLAVRAGALVAGVGMYPFSFEGAARVAQAEEAAARLAHTCHARMFVAAGEMLDPGREAWSALTRAEENLAGSALALATSLGAEGLAAESLEELCAAMSGDTPCEYALVRADGADLLHEFGQQLRGVALLKPRLRPVQRAVAVFHVAEAVAAERVAALKGRLKTALPQRARLTAAAVSDPGAGAGLRLSLWVFRDDLRPRMEAPPSLPEEMAPVPGEAPPERVPDEVPETEPADAPAPVEPVEPTLPTIPRGKQPVEQPNFVYPDVPGMPGDDALVTQLDQPTWKRLRLQLRQVTD
jgi:cell division GTPase FtsZ